jgi:hypothetical protein
VLQLFELLDADSIDEVRLQDGPIVDEDVEAPESADRSVDERSQAIDLGQIEAHGDGLPATGLDLLRHLVAEVRVARRHHDAGTGLRETTGDRASGTPARTRDDRRTAR